MKSARPTTNLSFRHSSWRNLLFPLVLLIPASASAQGPATGAPPFGSFSGGPDVINNANLNIHLTVPVLHKPGRGMPFNYDLTYDSSVWKPVTSGSTTSWMPNSNLGLTCPLAPRTGSYDTKNS